MLELEHGFRVVDVRARLDPDEAVAESRGRAIGPDRLERELLQAGVVRALVSPGQRPPGEGYLRANNSVARLSVERPFLTVARLDGPLDPTNSPVSQLRNLTARRADHHATPEDVEQYAYDDRFHAFRLAPAVDGLPQADVLDELAAVGSPVLVDAGRDFPPAAVESTLLTYDFPVVLAGFGGFPLDTDLMDAALASLDDHEQLYLDTSFVRYREHLERGLLEHPDRILFGSGAPAAHPSVGVMELLTLDVSEDLLRRAFDKNPTRVVPALAAGTDD